MEYLLVKTGVSGKQVNKVHFWRNSKVKKEIHQ